MRFITKNNPTGVSKWLQAHFARHFTTLLKIVTRHCQGQSSPTISVGLNLDIPVNDLLSALMSYQLLGVWDGMRQMFTRKKGGRVHV